MGQIQTPQMELEAFCAKLAPVFLDYLRTHGTAIDRIEEATSLDGITSLPARYSLGGVEKNVLAPLKLLTKDVDAQIDACVRATTNANMATDKANAAATRVTNAITDISAEKAAAQAAAAKANTAATNADNSRGLIEQDEYLRKANEQTRQTQESARQAAEIARQSQESTRQTQEDLRQTNATTIIAALNIAKTDADAAAIAANEAADRVDESITDIVAEKAAAIEAAKFANEAADRVDESIVDIEAEKNAAIEATTKAIEAAEAAKSATEQLQSLKTEITVLINTLAPRVTTLESYNQVKILTQAEYNALAIKNDKVLYIVDDGTSSANTLQTNEMPGLMNDMEEEMDMTYSYMDAMGAVIDNETISPDETETVDRDEINDTTNTDNIYGDNL